MESKKGSNKQKNLKSKNKLVMTIIISAALFILVVMFMYMESKDGQLIINNDTDLNLEYVNAKFVCSRGDLTDEINTKSIKANQIYKKSIDPVNLIQTDANYEIRFKYEGYDELLVDTGTFNDTFEGNIKIDFKKTEDPYLIKMTIKASNGLLPSRSTNCNDEYTINLKKGELLE